MAELKIFRYAHRYSFGDAFKLLYDNRELPVSHYLVGLILTLV